MHTLWNDLRNCARMLRKNPGFALTAIVTLALGIGANAAIFGLADKLLLRPLPVSEPERLVLINSVSVSPHFVSNVFSWPDYADYRDQNQVFSGLAAFSASRASVQSGDVIERVPIEVVSATYFDVLGVATTRGRTFTSEECETPGTHPVAVISDGFWRRHFGAAADVIGRTIVLKDTPLTIIGVAAPEFSGMLVERAADIWVPAAMDGALLGRTSGLTRRNFYWVRLVARLREGISASEAQAGLDIVAQQIRQTHNPQLANQPRLPFSEQHIELEPAGQGVSWLRKSYAQPLAWLLAFVGLVLLIACANVANLLLARAMARRRELAVRLALGATRGRLVRQLLTESGVLALLGGALGLLLMPWVTALLLRFEPSLDAGTPLGTGIDARVLGFSVLVTTLSGLVFGLIPALRSSRHELLPALKDEGSLSDRDGNRFNLRGALVVVQVALACVVLIGAGLLTRSLGKLFAIDPGFETTGVLLVPIELDSKSYDEVRGRAFFEQAREHIRALPGVAAVSASEIVPLSGSFYASSVFIEGYTPAPDEAMSVECNFVGPDYHGAMGIRILRGRGFSEEDRADSPGVAIISESMAQRYFSAQDPLGKRITLGTGAPQLEIIGVAGDVKYQGLTESSVPHLDLASSQQRYNGSATLTIRASGPVEGLTAAVRREIQSLDPAIPLAGIRPMSEQLSDSLATSRMAATLTSMFGLLSLLLSVIGLYGVMAYAVSRRTREIGIRIALGARRGDVLRLVVGSGLVMALIGVGVGLIAAFAITRWMESLLFGVATTDSLTFASATLLLIGVSIVACWLPARRAANVDPMVALRYE